MQQPQPTYADLLLARLEAKRQARRQGVPSDEPTMLQGPMLSSPTSALFQQTAGAIASPPTPFSHNLNPQTFPAPQPSLGERIMQRIGAATKPVMDLPLTKKGPLGGEDVTLGQGLGALGELTTQAGRQVAGRMLTTPSLPSERDIGQRILANKAPSPIQGIAENVGSLALPGIGIGKGLKASPVATKAAPAVTKQVATHLPANAPAGIARAATVATEKVAQDKPGAISNFFDHIPVVKQARRVLRPGLDMPDSVLVANVAEGDVAAVLRQQNYATEQQTLQMLEQAFGKGSTAEGGIANAKFIGQQTDLAPWSGTIKDIADRPHLYDLSVEQRGLLPYLDDLFGDALTATNAEYATEINRFSVANPGGWFLPNVDQSDAALEIFGGDLVAAAKSGGAATRVFGTAFDRWKANSAFKPVTNISLLLMRMGETRVTHAMRNTFREVSGGKTRIQVMDELHPNLVEAKAALTKQIASTRTQIETATRLGATLKGATRSELSAAKAAMKRAEPLLDRVAALDPEYGPELSYLSGQIRELQRAATMLTKEGMELYDKAVTQGTKRQALLSQLNALAPKLDSIRRSYEAADLRPYVLVQDGIFRYYPVAEARAIQDVRKISNNAAVKFAQNVTATKLSGDLSPLVGVQTPTGFLIDPVGVVKTWIKQNPLAHLSPQKFSELVAQDPKSWQEYAFYSGKAVTIGGTPQEFAGGFLSMIPKVGPKYKQINDALFLMVEIQSKGLWDQYAAQNLKAGMGDVAAKVAAADMVGKVYPSFAPRRMGLSPASSGLLRAATTSISFATKPAELMLDGARGMVKLGSFQRLTARERTGAQLMAILAASTAFASVSSAALTAYFRGTDIDEAIAQALNPSSRHFMAVTFADKTVPIGGPFRSFLKMVWPREVEGSPVPIPFWGVAQWLKSRGQPIGVAAIDLVRNKDFYGNKIYGSTFPWNIAAMLEYGAESVLPISIGQVASGVRTGQEIGDTGEQAIGGFAGINIQENTAYQERDLAVQRWAVSSGLSATSWADLSPSEQRAFATVNPQIAADLRRYQEQQAKNGVDWAVRQKQRNEAEDNRLKAETALEEEFKTRTISAEAFRDQYQNIQAEAVIRKQQVDKDYDLFKQTGERPADPNKAALFDYYRAYDEAKTVSGRLDWEALDTKLAALQATWTLGQQKYVDDNTSLAGHPPLIKEWKDGKDRFRNYWNAGSLILQGMGQPELESIYNQYKSADARTQYAIDKANKGLFAQVQRAETAARTLARRKNPQLDAFLIRFGYASSPGNAASVKRMAAIQNLNMPLQEVMATTG